MFHQEIKRERHKQEKSRKMSLATMMGSSTESREGRGSLSKIKAESSSRKFQHFGCLFSNSRIVPGSVNRPVWKMAVHLSRSLNKDKDDHDGEETLRKEGEFMNSAWNFLKIFYGLFRFFFHFSIFNDRLKISWNQGQFLVTAWGKLRSNVQKENEVKLRNFIVDALFEEETFTQTVSSCDKAFRYCRR